MKWLWFGLMRVVAHVAVNIITCMLLRVSPCIQTGQKDLVDLQCFLGFCEGVFF